MRAPIQKMTDSQVVVRLVELKICTAVDGRRIMRFLRSATSVRKDGGPYSASYDRALARAAINRAAPRCRKLLARLDERTPSHHLAYTDTCLIPLRALDPTHSSIPRPTSRLRNKLYFNADPRKRGFMIKVALVVRLYDGAILEVPCVMPGSVHDMHLAPSSRTLPYLCDKAYQGVDFNAVVPYKKPPGRNILRSRLNYNRAHSQWRVVNECVNGQIKTKFPRLDFWRGRGRPIGPQVHAAWLCAAVVHNVQIAHSPLVRRGRAWEWLLSGELESSDPWRGGVLRMIGCGGDRGPPPTPEVPFPDRD